MRTYNSNALRYNKPKLNNNKPDINNYPTQFWLFYWGIIKFGEIYPEVGWKYAESMDGACDQNNMKCPMGGFSKTGPVGIPKHLLKYVVPGDSLAQAWYLFTKSFFVAAPYKDDEKYLVEKDYVWLKRTKKGKPRKTKIHEKFIRKMDYEATHHGVIIPAIVQGNTDTRYWDIIQYKWECIILSGHLTYPGEKSHAPWQTALVYFGVPYGTFSAEYKRFLRMLSVMFTTEGLITDIYLSENNIERRGIKVNEMTNLLCVESINEDLENPNFYLDSYVKAGEIYPVIYDGENIAVIHKDGIYFGDKSLLTRKFHAYFETETNKKQIDKTMKNYKTITEILNDFPELNENESLLKIINEKLQENIVNEISTLQKRLQFLEGLGKSSFTVPIESPVETIVSPVKRPRKIDNTQKIMEKEKRKFEYPIERIVVPFHTTGSDIRIFLENAINFIEDTSNSMIRLKDYRKNNTQTPEIKRYSKCVSNYRHRIKEKMSEAQEYIDERDYFNGDFVARKTKCEWS